MCIDKTLHKVVWLRLGAGAMPWRRRRLLGNALGPRRFPISAREARSGSLNRNLDGSFASEYGFFVTRNDRK